MVAWVVGRCRDQGTGLGQIGNDLGVHVGHRAADRAAASSGLVTGREPDRHVSPELHQVVIVERPEEVRLTQDLVLLGVIQVRERRDLEENLIGPIDPVVDRIPDLVDRGVVGPKLVGIGRRERGERADMLDVVSAGLRNDEVPVVVWLELERVVGPDQRGPGAFGGGDGLVVGYGVDRALVQQGIAAGQ